MWLQLFPSGLGKEGIGAIVSTTHNTGGAGCHSIGQGSRAQCIVQLTLRIILIGLLGWCSPPGGCTIVVVCKVLVLQGVGVSNLAGSVDYTVSKYVA